MATASDDFDAALVALGVYIRAKDWLNAKIELACADAANLRLDVEGASGEMRTRRRETLTPLRVTIEAIEAASERAADQNRFATTRTRHP